MIRPLLLGFIRVYKLLLAPWLPGSCRFEPTCSVYAREAIERHGSLRGCGLALRRLLRCRPGGPAGLDPVPERPSQPARRHPKA